MGRPSVTSPHSFVSLLLLILSYEKQNVYSREEVFPELSGKGPECELEAPVRQQEVHGSLSEASCSALSGCLWMFSENVEMLSHGRAHCRPGSPIGYKGS